MSPPPIESAQYIYEKIIIFRSALACYKFNCTKEPCVNSRCSIYQKVLCKYNTKSFVPRTYSTPIKVFERGNVKLSDPSWTSSHYMYIQSNVETFLPGSGEKCRSVFLGSAVEHFESSNKLIKKECKSTGPPAYSNTSESDTLHGYSDQ